MDTQPTSLSSSAPNPSIPEAHVPPDDITKRNPLLIWSVATGVILAGIMLLYVFRSSIIPTKSPPPELVSTPLPSPTPIRNVSSIASQSAFMSLEQSVSSVSSAIANTNLDDPSLMPPSIDLPLGFVP